MRQASSHWFQHESENDMQQVTTRGGRIVTILSLVELIDFQEHGSQLRAFCPIHGSDHQRSLSISSHNGWGYCFNCHAIVLLKEYAPEIARRLLARIGQSEAGTSSRPFTPQRFPRASSERDIPSWQAQERQILRFLAPSMREALTDYWVASAYLESRMIPVELAQAEGVGYLPSALLVQQPRFLQRWADRLLFPLRSPKGNGYIGRSLWRWRLGMDENEHKTLLEREDGNPRRWIKTNPAGLICAPPINWDPCVILVESGFDRLALLAAALRSTRVVALAGTSLDPNWMPEHLKAVVLALNSDAAGQTATQRLVKQLDTRGLLVASCPPPQDGWGKDWSERWRLQGRRGLQPIIDILLCVRGALEQEHTSTDTPLLMTR
jgi:DNA primase